VALGGRRKRLTVKRRRDGSVGPAYVFLVALRGNLARFRVPMKRGPRRPRHAKPAGDGQRHARHSAAATHAKDRIEASVRRWFHAVQGRA
jgi:hypothetical protein